MDICRASGHFLSTLYHISTHHLFIITIEEKHDNVFKQHQETGKCTAQKVFSHKAWQKEGSRTSQALAI